MEGPNVCSVFYQIHYSKTKALITWIYIYFLKKAYADKDRLFWLFDTTHSSKYLMSAW